MNIIEWIVSEKLAKNNFAAAHVANGLKLAELAGDMEAQKARVKLYRDWRNSKIFGSHTTPCYEKAIAGEAVPQETLFPEAKHSEENRDPAEGEADYEYMAIHDIGGGFIGSAPQEDV